MTLIPKFKSPLERLLFLSVILSPFWVFGHFTWRLSQNAYPPQGDSIMIPLFFYWFLAFPPFAIIAYKGRKYLDVSHAHPFWNIRRHGLCFLLFFVCLYPIGLFLVFLLLDAISGRVYPSILYFSSLVYALFIYRAGAINRPGKNRAPITASTN